MGEGFALRWCQKHDVVIGSREEAKAKEAAGNYAKAAVQAHGKIEGSISGADNFSVAKGADFVILSIPYEFIQDSCAKMAPNIGQDCIVVSPIVPMTRTDNGFVYIPLEQNKKTAAELVADSLPPRGRVVSAFHTISEMKLKNAVASLDADTFICGDDQNSISKLSALVSEIQGLRPIVLGPLAISYQAEMLTPMLLNAARKNKLKNPGIKLIQ